MHAAAKDTQNHIKTIKNHFDEDGRRIKNDINDAANHLKGDVSHTAHAVGEQVREFIEGTGEHFAQAKETFAEATDNVAAQFRENPLPASAIALGVGLLLGAFFFRRA